MKTYRTQNLLTAEGEKLLRDGGIPWNVYPRPMLERDSFVCLNGKWQFSDREEGDFTEEILVPFPPESFLSGIGRRLGKNPTVRYRRTFDLPDGFIKKTADRVILHFGAVDQIAEVWLNGNFLGSHTGGYEAFSFDITEFLRDENELTVTVRDRLSDKILPYGKQREDRGGMWYTPITGIWQTVWLECVPEQYVRSLKIDIHGDCAEITAEGISDGVITVTTPDGDEVFPVIGAKAVVKPKTVRKWSASDPYLYRFTLVSGEDRVKSYFALRTVDICVIDGVPRICVNGEPVFFHGLLDQGYWSDGIMTPASAECFEQDILAAKSLGFNTLRKHIKLEPQRFYYDCDRLGMYVFQDMVNCGTYSFFRDTALPTVGVKNLPSVFRKQKKAAVQAFEKGMESAVNALYSHPSVVYWTVFNEGWGQCDEVRITEKMYSLDSSRIIDSASGWFTNSRLRTDTDSPHVYFKPVKIKIDERPTVLSEFGGYSYKPEGHAYNLDKTYGYRFFTEREKFEDALIELYENEIIPAAEKGLSGAIYTQISDVEDETNGLLSYDRKIVKVSPERMKKIAGKLGVVL